jgi:hypothetical protein
LAIRSSNQSWSRRFDALHLKVDKLLTNGSGLRCLFSEDDEEEDTLDQINPINGLFTTSLSCCSGGTIPVHTTRMTPNNHARLPVVFFARTICETHTPPTRRLLLLLLLQC